MITKLILTNFQQHQSLEVSIDNYVTVVKGRNGTGKTTIFRALRWLCTNKGRVESLIKHGENFVEAELHIDNHVIIRHAGDENYYKLDGEIFRSFGTNVPEPIAKIVNVCQDNFQGQLDNPFWFMETPGQVSKEMNQIINLEVIDKTLANIDSRVRRAKSTIEVTSDRLNKAKEDRDNLDWVLEADEDLCQIESLADSRANLQTKISTLKELIDEIDEICTAKNEIEDQIKDAKSVIDAYSKSDLEAKILRVDRLRQLISILEHKGKLLCQYEESLQQVKAESQKYIGKTCPVCNQKIKSLDLS